ncbi:MAG TPA: hypothetical protein VIR15_18130 [Intrasporangium sp.]|jgi:hypothetical protein|uniref:hypothetical protein n=1 Tax=Intrasporangium sp. TaxID=1925024 RepID=UPI002F91E615
MPLNRVLPYAVCLVALSGIAACGSADEPTPGRHATATVVKSLVVTVTGTTVTPAPAQVDLRIGEALDLTVTIDHDDELHAHGFGDIEEQLKAGVPTTVRLVGAESGVFEVETHEPALTLLTVAVR